MQQGSMPEYLTLNERNQTSQKRIHTVLFYLNNILENTNYSERQQI